LQVLGAKIPRFRYASLGMTALYDDWEQPDKLEFTEQKSCLLRGSFLHFTIVQCFYRCNDFHYISFRIYL